MRTKAVYSELQVHDVTVTVGERTILSNIRAQANSGEILAILGPTGSGKTTLLNAISGRLKTKSGQVTLNGHPFSKRLRRRLAFVKQHDVFFSHLTLWETLYFTAQIRLPELMTEKEKREKVDEIINQLDMTKCADTVIGDMFVRGLSGGEKKRVSIACELLTDPDILLMDEPTSGLDSSTALSIMQQMKVYANTYNKTIIMAIHQPSSQIYHMFTNILLLINGQEAYYGPARNSLQYFETIGYTCEPHFNPADFLLQMAKSDQETVGKILEAATRHRSVTGSDNQVLDSKGNVIPASTTTNGDAKVQIHRDDSDVTLSLLQENDESKEMTSSRWVTSWWTQYYMLSWRRFRQTKGGLLEGHTIIQNIIVTLVVGLLYWQIEMTAANVRDIMGLIYFTVFYWSFSPAFDCIAEYPSEKAVIAKERSAGSYRLSAYFISKATADVPLLFTLPTFMHLAFFIMSGVGGVKEFFITYPIILLQVLLSQAFGFFLSVAWDGELKPAFTTFSSYSLSAMMLGGFYTQVIPPWLAWAKYASYFIYPFGAVSHVIMAQLAPFPCNETLISAFPQCEVLLHHTTNQTVYIFPKDILDNAGITLPFVYYVFPVIVLLLIFRIAGYVIMRFRRTQLL